jgi:hypothetical protein
MLTDFLHFDDVAVTRHRPSGCIGELIAVPTAPRPITKSMQLFHSAPAFADKIKSLATEAPPDMLRAKDLRGQVDKPVAPRLRPNTQTVCFVAPFPPVTRVLANISSPPHGADIDNAGLLYCPSPVAAPPPHNRNPLEIAIVTKYLCVSMYFGCASLM